MSISNSGLPATGSGGSPPHRALSLLSRLSLQKALSAGSFLFSSSNGSPAGMMVAGLGGGFSQYNGSASSMRHPQLSASPAAGSGNALQHRASSALPRSGRGSFITTPSASLASGGAGVPQPPPLQVLPLQPPSPALPCAASLPEGLPCAHVGVEVHRLGLFQFKGASAPLPMVEVVARHLAPRRQLLLAGGSAVVKGPKGGLVSPQEGLVQAVEGVQLHGLVQLFQQQHAQRTAAAAAASAAAASHSARHAVGRSSWQADAFGLPPPALRAGSRAGSAISGSSVAGGGSVSLATRISALGSSGSSVLSFARRSATSSWGLEPARNGRSTAGGMGAGDNGSGSGASTPRMGSAPVVAAPAAAAAVGGGTQQPQ
jgi:hypothetical protein